MIHLGKFEGVLLASDFDDTLVGSDCEVSRGNREALEYFVREGGRFTVSTGRAHRTFAPYVDAAPINAPVILSNGALLYDFRAGRTVVDLPLPVCAAEDLGELCSAIPALGVETYHGDDVYIYRPNAHTQRHVERVKTTWTEMGTKGGMVLKLAELLGIRREHIYCVGDNQNDIPMLAVSAIPFAPANCAQAVKDWGATVLGSCDEDCIAQIIGILDLRY